jgi:hypothetical protein
VPVEVGVNVSVTNPTPSSVIDGVIVGVGVSEGVMVGVGLFVSVGVRV